jgi:hypothetical protein
MFVLTYDDKRGELRQFESIYEAHSELERLGFRFNQWVRGLNVEMWYNKTGDVLLLSQSED